MANCKYCGQQISRLDKEICPFCGGKKPLDGTDTTTQDITQVLGQTIDPKNVKHHSRVVAAILAFLLGFLGVHNFYLEKNKMGLITLAVSAVLIGGVGALLYFLMNKIIAFLIPYFVVELFMIILGLNYLIKRDVTDGNGEFLD